MLLDQVHDLPEVGLAHIQVHGHDGELRAARRRLLIGHRARDEHYGERDDGGAGDRERGPVPHGRLHTGGDEGRDGEVRHERDGRDQDPPGLQSEEPDQRVRDDARGPDPGDRAQPPRAPPAPPFGLRRLGRFGHVRVGHGTGA
nr:hypothetical protein GCM10025732_08300 [Glycomyces mayteni]